MGSKNLISLVLLFLTFQLNGQSYIVEKYSDKEGLNHSVVYRVFEDRKGFIWVATDNGLNRFDGNEFSSLNNQSTLVSDYLFGMAEVDSTLLFTSYNSGVLEYSMKNRRFQKSIAYSRVKKPIDIYVYNQAVLIIDNIGDLWLFQNKKFLGKIHSVTNVMMNKSGIYLANGTSGISRLVIHKQTFALESVFKINEGSIAQIIPLKNGHWLLLESESLLDFNPKTGTVGPLKGSEKFNLRFVGYKPAFEDSYGDIWIGSSEGTIYQYLQEEQTIRIVFQNTVVNQIFEDSNKNLWIATYGFGLWKIPPFRTKENAFNGHLTPDFGIVQQGNSQVFVGYRGLYLSSNDRQILTDIQRFRSKFRTANTEGIVYVDDKQFFYSHKFRLFYNDWKNTTREVHFKSNESALVSQILPFGKEEVVIATRDGAFHYNSRSNKLTVLPRLKHKIVYSVNSYGDSFVFCTNDGVYVGDLFHQKKVYFPNKLTAESIRSAALLSKNSLIVGSNKRIFHYNLASGKTRRLYDEVYCSKIIKAYGYTWVLCDKGLIRVDREWKTHLISSEYGVPGWAKSMIVKNNKFFILYQDRVLEISANKLLNLPKPQKFLLFNDYVNYEGKNRFTTSEIIRLNEPLKKMVFKFAMPKYMGVKTATYVVRINADVELEGSRSGKFNILSLPDGANKLTFYSLDEDKHVLAKKVYYVHNPYPFWRHPLMQIAYLLLIICISWFIFSWRVKKLNRRKALELETNRLVYELKQKSLLNMLNPHFLNNAINSIQAFVVMNDQRRTLKYLSQFARLMRLNLELMNSSMVPLSKEVDSIRFYVDFEQVRTSGTFDFEVVTKTTSDLADFLVPSFIIQPFVENAIWHGILTTADKKGKILLTIEERQDDLLILVDDDGIGISQSMLQKSDNSLKISLGTKIIKERFDILRSGDKHFYIEIVDKSDFSQSGTQVRITVPKTFLTNANH